MEAILDLLLGIGFIGARKKEQPQFIFKYYGSEGNVFGDVDDVAEFGIHPAFAKALNLREASEKVEIKEAGESDIVTSATFVHARSAAAYEESGALIAGLSDIAPGPAGFRRYEELMLQVVGYAFQGYLDNPQFQERNWAGTQVRDLVFDNTGETLFFTTIRNMHGATSIVFECKNKSTLEPSDFHQIESRLSKGTGFVGFICYRAQRREPVKAEVEHLREMFNRSERRSIVLLMSDANVHQLLEKRMRGKLDRFMYGWYTTYLRNYLS